VSRFRSRGHHACPRCGGHLSIAGHHFDAHHQRRDRRRDGGRKEVVRDRERRKRREREMADKIDSRVCPRVWQFHPTPRLVTFLRYFLLYFRSIFCLFSSLFRTVDLHIPRLNNPQNILNAYTYLPTTTAHTIQHIQYSKI
jgi:hypothetical protein